MELCVEIANMHICITVYAPSILFAVGVFLVFTIIFSNDFSLEILFVGWRKYFCSSEISERFWKRRKRLRGNAKIHRDPVTL